MIQMVQITTVSGTVRASIVRRMETFLKTLDTQPIAHAVNVAGVLDINRDDG